MTTKTKEKWTELIEGGYFMVRHTTELGIQFNELTWTQKDDIFKDFLEILTPPVLPIYSEYSLKNFVEDSGLDGNKTLSLDFDTGLKYHNYNLRGIVQDMTYAVLYNWKALFLLALEEINSTIIERTTIKYKTPLSFTQLTVDEAKEFIKMLLNEISKQPNFIDLYNKWIAPYQLK